MTRLTDIESSVPGQGDICTIPTVVTREEGLGTWPFEGVEVMPEQEPAVTITVQEE